MPTYTLPREIFDEKFRVVNERFKNLKKEMNEGLKALIFSNFSIS
jgi:hypothetical protein